MAFYGLEGWPEDRADYRAAYTSWVVASQHGGRHKLRDFVPDFDPRPANTLEEVQAWFMALAEKEKNG